MRWPRKLALGAFLIALVILAEGGWMLARFQPGVMTVWIFVGLGGLGCAIAALGLVIAQRVQGNPVGFLLAWVGSIVVFLAARDVYYGIADEQPGRLPIDSRVVALFEESGWWLLVAVALLLLYFPDGRLPGRRWRAAPAALVVLGAAQQAYGVVASEPFMAPLDDLARPFDPASPGVEVVSVVSFFALLLLFLASGASLVFRFRRSVGVPRAQLKWLALAGTAAMLYPFLCLAEVVATGRSGSVAVVFGVVTLVALPASIAVAMLRHDLYDVDRVLADSVTYAIVTVVLLSTYAVTAFTLGLVLGRGSPVSAAAATAVCALLLSPLRHRLQKVVDRRLYQPRRAVLLAIEDLQRRIHAGDGQPEDLESALRSALRDPELRVGMLVPGSSGFVDAAGAPVSTSPLVPVMLGGAQIGALASSDGRTSGAVLRVIATNAASLVEVARLRAELAQAIRDVGASRARLVQAGNAERKRLERNLHDGAQQRLVSLGMSMRLAQRHLDDGSVDVNALLDRGVAELTAAIAELRQIAHGLRPTSLDDGLHAALSALTQSMPIPVRLRIDPELVADDVATIAYFVAAEAIANAAKYSNASAIAVHVAKRNGDLRVRVEDDGCGGATARPGSGLTGLVDRVAAVGGSWSLDSPAGRGTTVEVVLPCGS